MGKNKSEQIMSKILIVDDIPANIGILSNALEPEGYEILAASNGEAALRAARLNLPDVIILDVLMPGIDGLETCRRLKKDESTRDIPVIFVTAKGETEDIIEGFRVGGVDYIPKPYEKEEILVRVQNHLKISTLTKELVAKNRKLEREIARREKAESERDQAEDARRKADDRLSLISEQEANHWGIAAFVGRSRTIKGILREIRQLHNTGTTSVLITGESGTGKELIARAIHFGGPRAKAAFIPVNCTAIPAELADSLFFGHVKGAFTGATSDRKGYFDLADGGTLFLDEIGDMPADTQAKLLRVLEDGSIMPIGARREKLVDVRVIAATNADLKTKMDEGKFRDDVYFRLAAFPVHIPPLREHPEDIPLLVDHFLGLFATEMGIQRPQMDQEALSALKSYFFPGNVRELKNVIERALIESGGVRIQLEHLHLLQPSPVPISKEETGSLVAVELYRRMAAGGESFWDIVHAPFLDRELNRSQVQAIIEIGLGETGGSYKALLPIFGMSESDYKKFMDFLRHNRLRPVLDS
jgi:DNA-binding NtrC family response regulator